VYVPISNVYVPILVVDASFPPYGGINCSNFNPFLFFIVFFHV
jgi:hypothetical protein